MFEVLTDRLNAIFKKLGGKGRLSEKDIDEGLRQVRLALLEADVNFKVVKDFVARVREQAVAAPVLESLTPGQQIVKIVNREIIAILGGGHSQLTTAGQPPSIAMLVGLQGSGKTTTAAKLALHLKGSGQRPLLAAVDPYRAAARQQLMALGQQLDLPVYGRDGVPPRTLCEEALRRAREIAATWLILDTAGRLHIDQEMMQELVELRQRLSPHEVLLVVDAMTGQDAVRVAQEFNAQVPLSGLILTKMDGDARGGAALSIRAVTGIPIKFIGTGEKADALEPFYPDRLASRILGMGDMLSLIEKAERTFDEQRIQEMEKKMRSATMDLEDFLWQLQQMKKMGPLSQLVEMIPGLGKLARQMPSEVDDKQLKRIEAVIYSMTPEERRTPQIIGGSRRRRIARGSGTTPQDVNQLLNQFQQAQKLTRQLKAGKGGGLAGLLR